LFISLSTQSGNFRINPRKHKVYDLQSTPTSPSLDPNVFLSILVSNTGSSHRVKEKNWQKMIYNTEALSKLLVFCKLDGIVKVTEPNNNNNNGSYQIIFLVLSQRKM